ncbi:uncharacterized protein [Solanum lycopersicum]|uniref:uncharacterized protein n=1 Tax=Solanum lycopersicum TaxID=4081 RepID=UPI003748F178
MGDLQEGFFDRLFYREKREAKVEEFINFFIKDEMSYFLTGLSDDLKEKCLSAMLHDNMIISHLMAHAQQVEEPTVRRKSRDSNKVYDDRVSNRKSQKGRGTSAPIKNPTFSMCGKNHFGDCLVEIDNCFCCGKSANKGRYCPNLKVQDKGSDQAQASGSNVAKKCKEIVL